MIDSLVKAGVVAVLRAPSPEAAFRAGMAAFQGGIRALEVTFTVPRAEETIARLRKELSDQAIVGAGTVLNFAQAQQASDAGAQFSVSPHTDVKLIEWHLSRELTYVPGGMTPTELVTAWNAGARLLKLFPASVGGPAFVRSILQALPKMKLMVTGGVDEKSAIEFVRAGASIVCVGGNAIGGEAVASGDWKRIESACAAVVQSVGHA